MPMNPASVVNRYDHRLRDLVRATADSTITRKNGVPRSTAAGWIKNKPKDVLSIQPIAPNPPELQQEIVRLREQIAKLRSLLRLIFVILRLSGFKLERCRIPDPKNKRRLIQAVDRATAVIPKRTVLAVIGLSYSRFHAWTNADICQLTDLPHAQRAIPINLLATRSPPCETWWRTKELRHLSTCGLVRLARKLGKVFASQT